MTFIWWCIYLETYSINISINYSGKIYLIIALYYLKPTSCCEESLANRIITCIILIWNLDLEFQFQRTNIWFILDFHLQHASI